MTQEASKLAASSLHSILDQQIRSNQNLKSEISQKSKQKVYLDKDD